MGVTIWIWRRTTASLALGVALAIAGLAAGAEGPRVETPVWMGTGSCAAIACHGGRREPLGLKGSEYSFSGAYDPHIRAFSVLYDDRSKLIEKNYRRLADLESSRPFEDDACLRCHVHQGYDTKVPQSRSAQFEVSDGVSCEGCHGPAGKWLVPHTEYGWKGLSDEQKSGIFGMRPTKDLLARGQSCAECHVGNGPADVNHDLIAAGHPRMKFEYGSQLAKLPKHWRIADDKARHPDYEAKVWALGQLLAAKASLDLLESRARRSIPENSTVPWPEFAEYSCYSCHHELVQGGWAAANASRAPQPGTLQWGTWYSPMARTLAAGRPDLVLDDLGSLRGLMAEREPNPAEVARQAHAASDKMGRLADAVNLGQIPLAEMRVKLKSVFDDAASPLDWDRAAQRYLAIVAFDKALSDFDPRYADPIVKAGLDRMLKDLDLPVVVQRRGGIFDSPYRFDPEQIKGDLKTVQDALPQKP